MLFDFFCITKVAWVRRTWRLLFRPEDTAVPHNVPDNHVHICSLFHAPAFLLPYSEHPADVTVQSFYTFFTASVAAKIAFTAALLFGADAT